MFVSRQHKSVCAILKLMQEGLLYPHSDQTVQMTSTGLCILPLEHSTGFLRLLLWSEVSKISLDVTDGRQRECCQTIESFNGLCVIGTQFVWQTKSACVWWVCNVGSLELCSIQKLYSIRCTVFAD